MLDFCTVRLYNICMNELFESFPQALSALAYRLKSRPFSADEYNVVLTPDRYTQSVESMLFTGGGSLSCEVLTLSRLSRRVLSVNDSVSREGGVMIAACAIAAAENKQKFEYYSKAIRFYDFAREVYDTLQQIASSDIDMSDITASGSLGGKLRDLTRIKHEYDKIKADAYDAPDRLHALIEHAPTDDFIKHTHFYAIGFWNTTKLNRRALGAIAKSSRNFELYDIKPFYGCRKEMTVFGAPDKVSEYKELAVRILDCIYSGGHYGDIAVICPSPRALKRIFGEYGIPVYADETKPLAQTEPLVALSLIYKLHTGLSNRNAIDVKALISLCKNRFAAVPQLCAEMLQSVAAVRGLSYVPEDYDFCDDNANFAAQTAVKLVKCFGGQKNFQSAVKAVICAGEFQKTMDECDDKTDAVTPILNLVELSEKYGYGGFDALAKAFFASAMAVNINTLPRERDCVIVTMPQALRLTACKKLFIADFNEGILPNVITSSGLLSDAELNALGGVIEPSVRLQNGRARDELRAVVNNAESVFCAYSSSGGGRPSSFIRELADNIEKLDYAERQAVILRSDDCNLLSMYAPVASAAREIAALGLSKYARSFEAAVERRTAVAAPFENVVANIAKSTVSVSELTHWFECPYKRFLADSVGLKDRRRQFDASDLGTDMHEVMRRFIKIEPYDCSREAITRIVDTVLEERGETPDPVSYKRIVDDAVDFASENAQIISVGQYDPALTEYRFNGKKFFGKSKTEFVGFIDRVDVCGNRARIIDYKTRSYKSFDVKQCVNGCDMQLPLYAYAIGDRYDVTGMFYVNLLKKFNTDNKKAMSGCIVNDVDIAAEYDEALSATGKSSILPLKLTKKGRLGKNGTVTDHARFDAIIKRCVRNADVAVDEIAAGYINKSPINGECKNCKYLGLCGGGDPRSVAPDLDDETEQV